MHGKTENIMCGVAKEKEGLLLILLTDQIGEAKSQYRRSTYPYYTCLDAVILG